MRRRNTLTDALDRPRQDARPHVRRPAVQEASLLVVWDGLDVRADPGALVGPGALGVVHARDGCHRTNTHRDTDTLPQP